MIYNRSSSIVLDETSSYWSALKSPNFSAFHWSPHSSLVSVGQNFVTTRVVHLPKRTETSLLTESDQSGPNQQLLQLRTARIAWSESDQAVRAVHSCIGWFYKIVKITIPTAKEFESLNYLRGQNPSKSPKRSTKHGWLVVCFGFNGPLRQYFSLYRGRLPKGGRQRREG